jgi:hypothetical protein
MIALTLARGCVASICAAGLGLVATAPRDRSVPEEVPVSVRPITEPLVAHRNLDSLMGIIISRDAFRANRTPAAVRYGQAPEEGAAAIRRARPALRLTGVILGVRAAAVIEGLPGVTGARVVESGERYGDVVVGRISPDTVWVAGTDTTWALTLVAR